MLSDGLWRLQGSEALPNHSLKGTYNQVWVFFALEAPGLHSQCLLSHRGREVAAEEAPGNFSASTFYLPGATFLLMAVRSWVIA